MPKNPTIRECGPSAPEAPGVLEHVSEMAVVIRGETVAFANRRFEKTTGYRSLEVVGRPAFDLIGRSTPAGARRALALAVRRGRIWSGPLSISTKHGLDIDCEVTILPGAASGEQTTIVLAAEGHNGFVPDQDPNQDRKLRAVGEFAGSIAHSLNNYLTVMRAHIASAKDSDGSGLESQLDELDRATEGAGGLISQLLLFSRGGRAPQVLVDAVPLLLRAVDSVRRVMPESIEVRASIAEECRLLRSEEGSVEQILLNLASNARDAMPDGGTLTIEADVLALGVQTRCTTGSLPPGEFISVSVTDSGTGMEGETLANLFKPFYTTKPVGLGTGLGMSSVLELARKHSGQIDIASAPGRGTIVTVYLPHIPDQSSSPGESRKTTPGRPA